VVGWADAIPAVAKTLSVDQDGHLDLDVLRGDVESHKDLHAPARARGSGCPSSCPSTAQHPVVLNAVQRDED
jgi:hypothetical protein